MRTRIKQFAIICFPLIVVWVAIFFFPMPGWSQYQMEDICATEHIHNYLMQTDSVYRKNLLDMDLKVQAIIQNQENQNQENNKTQIPIFTIPVVVHVIHLGEPVGTGSNISKTVIEGAIDGLNKRFKNAIGAGVNVEIKFCLAERKPNGKATSGIVRVKGSGVPNYANHGIKATLANCGTAANENNIKDLSKWPVSDYYNIWVVNKICNGNWAGYAYFPSGSPYDGCVIDHTYMNYSSSVLTHEIGHAFNLSHTFSGDGNGNTCPVNSSCGTDGDGICDTPPHRRGDCGSSNPCSNNGVWNKSRYNYMSYCSYSNAVGRFTSGQKQKMRATAQVSPRNALLSSIACTPPSSSNIQQRTINAFADIEEDNSNSAYELNLYPNPFSNIAEFDYSLSKTQTVRISLYDILGKEIVVLKNQTQSEGDYTIKIDGSYLGLYTGVYFVIFKTEETSAYIKIGFMH